jgi:streptogramin lyase
MIRIDQRTNSPVSVIPVGRGPTSPTSVDGEIWVLNTNDRTISVIDPHTDTAAETFGGPIVGPGMAFGFDDVWVGNGDSLSRLNPTTHEATATIRFSHEALLPILVATGGGMVWARLADNLDQIDPVHNEVVTSLPIRGPSMSLIESGGIAFGEGAVWTSTYNAGVVTRVDPETGDRSPIDIGGNPAGITVGFGSIWVSNPGNGTITRIAPATGEFHDIEIGASSPSRTGGVSVGTDSVWAVNPHDHTVLRIDPVTEKIRVIRLPVRPSDILVTPEGVWVTVASVA